jgi:uncharacterized protein (DUF2062 family)
MPVCYIKNWRLSLMVTQGRLNPISIHSGSVNISVARETLYANLSQRMALCSVKSYAFLYSVILVLHIQETYVFRISSGLKVSFLLCPDQKTSSLD